MSLRALARIGLVAGLRLVPESVRRVLLAHVINHVSEGLKFKLGLPTMAGLLQHLRANGFDPVTVIDVGAFVGDWTTIAAGVFPSAKVIMIEGNPDNEKTLRTVQHAAGARVRLMMGLLGGESGHQVTFYKHDSGSSVFEELTSFDKTTIELQTTTLDTLMASCDVREPVLMKLDVQGSELEVLRGGSGILRASEAVILEVALIPYNRNAPLFADVVAFMAEEGFTVFDFCGQFRRQTDNALFQTDVVFVRHDSHLRAPKKFWLHEP